MIKSDKGIIQVKGTEEQLVAEFAVIAKAVRDTLTEDHDEAYADKVMAKAIENSKKSEEELALGVIENIIKILDMALEENDKKSKEDGPLDKPSTGNSAFDDFLEDIFGRGAENE